MDGSEEEEDKSNVEEGMSWKPGREGTIITGENGREENIAKDDVMAQVNTKDSEDGFESTNGESAKQVDGGKTDHTKGHTKSEEELPVQENEIKGVTFDYLRGSFVTLDTKLQEIGAYIDAECRPKAVLSQKKESASRGKPRLKVDAQVWTEDAHRKSKDFSTQARGYESRSKATQATRYEGESLVVEEEDLKIEESWMMKIPSGGPILESTREKDPTKLFEIHSSHITKRDLNKTERLLGRVLFQNADVEAFRDFLVRSVIIITPMNIISMLNYMQKYTSIHY